MVFELKDHLLRHLLGVEKKKIEQMVLHYISKLVGFAFCSPPTCSPVSPYIVPSMWFSMFFKLGFVDLLSSNHPIWCYRLKKVGEKNQNLV